VSTVQSVQLASRTFRQWTVAIKWSVVTWTGQPLD